MLSKTQYTIILTLSYMLGIIAFFKNSPILFSIIIAIVTISLLLFKKISKMLAIFIVLIFIFGISYTNHKMKCDDLLQSLAPSDVTIIGRVTTIPSTAHSNKTKFGLACHTDNFACYIRHVWLHKWHDEFDKNPIPLLLELLRYAHKAFRESKVLGCDPRYREIHNQLSGGLVKTSSFCRAN